MSTNMRIPVQGDLYAIVKTDDGFLEMKTIPLELDSEPSEDALAAFHLYSAYLSSQYASELPFIPCQYRKESIPNLFERRRAIALAQTAQRVNSQYNVVAMSHRLGGWKSFDWQYNNDITFQILSNFGYGSASYLMCRFFYKGLQLTPYSEYIRYRYAKYADIMEYTYNYSVEYNEWHHLMQDTLDFYNAVCNQREHQIFTWIEGHLRAMTDGLANLMNSDSTFTFYRGDGSITDVVKGDELICVKAQKISGAVDFIKNIRKLPVQVSPDTYIQKMLNICSQFTRDALSQIETLTTTISSLERQVNKLKHEHLLSLYDRIYDRNYYEKQWYLSYNKFAMLRYLLNIRNRLNIEEGLVRPALRKLDALLKRRDDLKSQLSNSKHIHYVLTEAVDKIDNYLQ